MATEQRSAQARPSGLFIGAIGLLTLSAIVLALMGQPPGSPAPDDFVWRAVRRAGILALNERTSNLTLLSLLSVPIALLIKLRNGWPAMSEHLTKHLLESLAPALIVLALVFCWKLFITVPREIAEGSQKQPTLTKSMTPTVATWMITAPYLNDGGLKRPVGVISTPKYTPSQPARIDIVKVVAVPAQNKAKEPGLFINVYYSNRGTVPAHSLIHQAVLVPSSKLGLTEAEELLYINLASSIDVKPPKSDSDSLARVGSMSENEIQPGDHPQHFFTVPGNDSDTASLGGMYPGFISGEQRLYLFIAVKYKDKTLPPKTVTMTEFCGWFSVTFEMWHNCGHNRVIRQSSGQ